MSKNHTSGPRSPVTFAVDEPQDMRTLSQRKPAAFDEDFELTPEIEDPFSSLAETPALPEPVIAAAKSRFSFISLGLTALGVLISLSVGLWTDKLIEDLFSRSDWLGYAALIALSAFLLAVFAILIREIYGLTRLSAVQSLKREIEKAGQHPLPAEARKVTAKLVALTRDNPTTAKGRNVLSQTQNDIIDGSELLKLAERQLMEPLDQQARQLILNAAKRVSVVTAVSPKAIVDIGYVVFEALRLVRAMAELYGGRPGFIGLLRLTRDVVAHLAVTGSIAVGDGIIQQLLGHGIASKISARLGEGVINGLMTARIGIAAMDLCRPMEFKALKRPGISDFVSDLTPKTGMGSK